jgi:glycosyltransferase involved in cell wall biosynthesis
MRGSETTRVVPRRRMRIAVVSKADAAGGGASKIAEMTARLLQPHADVRHFLTFARKPRAHHRSIRAFPGLTWLERESAKLSTWLGVPDYISLDWLIFSLRTRLQVDLVHFHDITGAFSPASLGLLARHLPICWTFHDCSPFTGGCIQPMNCTRFTGTCGPCPRLGHWPLATATDATGWMQRQKRVLARRGSYRAICPSHWIAHMAVQAGAFDERPTVIPNCVDTTVFAPQPKADLRQALGLPIDRPTVLVSAFSMRDPFKGVGHAIAALNGVRDLNPVVLLIGHGGQQATRLLPGLDVRPAGYLTDERDLARWYGAADVLLYPTLADNLPLAVLECMASGTPVVGYDTGGMREMLQHQVNGWLSPQGDTAHLTAGLQQVLRSDGTRRHWAGAARERIVSTFNQNRFLTAHLQVYAETIARFRTMGRSSPAAQRMSTCLSPVGS